METQATIPDVDRRDCPVCGESIKTAAIKCRYCGEDLEEFARKRREATERELFAGRPALVFSLGGYVVAVLTLGLALLVFWQRRASVRYVITTQRIRIERGILSRTRNNIELFRIDDYEVRRPLGMRIVGHAELLLKSSDRNTPDLTLRGIPGLEALAEELRECGLRERERRGIKVWADA